MNEVLGRCRWRSAIGLLAIGIVACGLPAYGAMNPATDMVGTDDSGSPTIESTSTWTNSKVPTFASSMPTYLIEFNEDAGGPRDTGVCIPPVGGPNHTCNGTQEGEWGPPCNDVTCGLVTGGDNCNAGCNSPLEVFGSISCGETICGTYAVQVAGETLRDTDWFEIEVTTNTYLHVRGTSEHDLLVGIIQTIGATGLCADMPETGFWVDAAFFAGCTEGFVIDGCVGPGKWWIFAAPDFAIGETPCSDYVLKLNCEPCIVGCCIGNDVCTETSGTHCSNPVAWGDLGGAIGGPDCATADCVWACPGTTLLCDSSQDVDNSINSDIANPPMSCATGASIGLLWFNFVATFDSVQISTCATIQADDSVFALYGGDCTNTLVELACSEDEDCGPGDWLGDICYEGLTTGQTYYIQFASWTAGSQGIYTLDLLCPCPAIAPGACCLPNGSCIPDKKPSECEPDPPIGLGGAYQGPGVPCDATTCEIGACCLQDGSCIETSETLCLTVFGGLEWIGGEVCDPNPCSGACCTFFFGNYTCANSAAAGCVAANKEWYEGEQCNQNLFECPDSRVCDIATDGTRCQLPAIASADVPQNIVAGSSDSNCVPDHNNGMGTRRAEDFVPHNTGITQVCWWGEYNDLNTTNPLPPVEVNDSFTITYYQDVGGCVGPVVAPSPFSEAAGTLTVTRTYSGERDATTDRTMIYRYEGTHAAVAVVPEDCYWIEIVNNTDDGTCTQTRIWYWQTSPFAQGNGFSLVDDFAPVPPHAPYPCGDRNTWRQYDLAFCLNVPNDPCLFCSNLCPGGSVAEGEPQCTDYYDDVYNIGCSDDNAPTPPLMTNVSCGEVICGKAGTFDCDIECVIQADCPVGEQCQTNGTCTGGPYNCRDVDWYRFTITELSMVEYCVTAQFPIYTEMWNPFGSDECIPNLGQLELVVLPGCQSDCGMTLLPAGVYYLFVAPDTFDGLPCVDDWTYVWELNCVPQFTPCTALDARSLRFHGANELSVQMGVSGGVDPRLGGIVKLEIDVDDSSGFGGTVGDVTVNCSQSGDISGTVSATSVNGNTVTVEFSAALPNGEACTVTLDCNAQVCVIGLEGDVDGNRVVATTDAGIIKPRFGDTADNTNARFDVDGNGTIATTDFGVVKPKFGDAADPCP